MIIRSNFFYLIALISAALAFKAGLKKSQQGQINGTLVPEQGSGSGSESMTLENRVTTANRSRKDYIIAIEDNAPMDERVDPVFQSLQRLAKRTRGRMAVMDYTSNRLGLNSPLEERLGYRNAIANDNNDFNDDNNDDYDDDDDSDDNDDYDGYNEGFDARLGGKQRLIGANVIKNLLGLRYAMEEERPRKSDEVQRTEEMSYEDKSNDYAVPPVVYEIKGNRRDEYANFDDNGDDEESNAYSKNNEPMFLFGNDRK